MKFFKIQAAWISIFNTDRFILEVIHRRTQVLQKKVSQKPGRGLITVWLRSRKMGNLIKYFEAKKVTIGFFRLILLFLKVSLSKIFLKKSQFLHSNKRETTSFHRLTSGWGQKPYSRVLSREHKNRAVFVFFLKFCCRSFFFLCQFLPELTWFLIMVERRLQFFTCFFGRFQYVFQHFFNET